jgi:hypothetical protein
VALDLPQPLAGAPMGIGIRLRVHSSIGVAAGDLAACQLRYLDVAFGTTRYLLQGRGGFSVGSNAADVIMGLDELGSAMTTTSMWGPAGLAIGTAVDINVQRFDAAFVLQDTTFLPAAYTWDPISQLGRYLAQLSGHDPMLDSILASVRKTY